MGEDSFNFSDLCVSGNCEKSISFTRSTIKVYRGLCGLSSGFWRVRRVDIFHAVKVETFRDLLDGLPQLARMVGERFCDQFAVRAVELSGHIRGGPFHLGPAAGKSAKRAFSHRVPPPADVSHTQRANRQGRRFCFRLWILLQLGDQFHLRAAGRSWHRDRRAKTGFLSEHTGLAGRLMQ